MAKKSKKAARHTASRPTRPRVQSGSTTTNPSRRGFLKKYRAGAIAIAVLGTGSWVVGSEVIASIEEGDLSKIGNGTPTIVQIHDPGCPTCRRLQSRVRAALNEFEDGKLQYLVANIRQSDGKQLAAKHNVGHVTLLLIDGSGKRTRVLQGLRDRDVLIHEFREFLVKAQSS